LEVVLEDLVGSGREQERVEPPFTADLVDKQAGEAVEVVEKVDERQRAVRWRRRRLVNRRIDLVQHRACVCSMRSE
jgi:hypothetical protein